MARVFYGGILMEANSFNPVLSTRDTFSFVYEGAELDQMESTSLEMGGVINTLKKYPEITRVPGYYAQACTSGPMAGSEFDFLAENLFNSLKRAMPVDGVLLVLHGAMQSDTVDDCEGYIISKVREIVGKDIPVCATFDFHALVSTEMVAGLNGASGYFTYPHVDHYQTGERAAEALVRLLKGVKTEPVCFRIPMIMSCENSNTIDTPMVPAMNMFFSLLKEQGVQSGMISMAQPWLDSKELGCTVCLFVDETCDRQRIEALAQDILHYIWDKREEFYPDMPKIDEALKIIQTMARPVILVDYGDVPNAGGTGDGVHVLKALLKAGITDKCALVVADAETCAKAEEVGEGNSGDFMIGSCGAPGEFNERIPVTAKVLKISYEPFVHLGPTQKGFVSHPGARVLLQTGSIYIVVCKTTCISHDRNIYLTMGIDPADMDIVCMRATHSFMSTYAGIYGSWIYVDTPGYSTRDVKYLPFRRVDRPIYPLDDITEFKFLDVVGK